MQVLRLGVISPLRKLASIRAAFRRLSRGSRSHFMIMEEVPEIARVACLVDSTANDIDEFARHYSSFIDTHDEIATTNRDCQYVREELQKLDQALREKRLEVSDDLHIQFLSQLAYIEGAFKLAKENVEQLKLWFPYEKPSSVSARLERVRVKLKQLFCADTCVARFNALAEDIFDAKTAVSQLPGFVQETPRQFPELKEDISTVEEGVKGVKDDISNDAEAVGNLEAAVTRRTVDIRNVGARVTRLNSDIGNADIGFATSEQKKLASTTGPSDNFRARFEVPMLPSDLLLDFDTCEHGEPVTMEGTLKHLLMTSDRTSDEPGAMTVALGAQGIGGVGKTSALIGLGWDPEVREAFNEGGIYFIYIGRDAQYEDVIKELARVVHASGGHKSSKDIGDTASLRAAVEITATFFEGRRTLFLCDDIWETDDSGVGYLRELKYLLATHQQSGLVISTRKEHIASANGCVPVTFAPLAPEGDRSLHIFLSHSRAEVSKQDIDQSPSEYRQALSQVLSRCAGVPLTLAIAGRAVSSMTQYEDYLWYQAVAKYVQDLQQVAISNVISEEFDTHPNFAATIRTSLQIADRWAEKQEFQTSEGQAVRCSQLFTAMAVLRPQSTVLHAMLGKLWQLSDDKLVHEIVNKLGDLNLVSPRIRTGAKNVVGVHDLLLEYCQLRAGDRLGEYHCDLLNEYFRSESDMMAPQPVITAEYAQLQPVNEHISLRTWWTAMSDGYIHENVCRHLAAGEYTSELVALLSHGRWTEFRCTYGGISAWESDFQHFFHSFKRNDLVSSEYDTKPMLDGLKLVRDSVKDAWPYIATNRTELAFQIHARLCDAPPEMWTVTNYLESTRAIVEKPWLKPVRRYWPLPGRASGEEIFREGSVSSISLTNDMVLAAVSVGSEVLVCNTDTRTILQRLRGHECSFESVAMSQDGLRIVSVSTDGALLMWHRSSTGTFHDASHLSEDDQLTSVAMTRDGLLVLSGSRDGSVKLWDLDSGSAVKELGKHDGSVTAVAVSEDGKRIVSCSRDGAMRLWDSVSGNQLCSLLWDSDSFVSCVAMNSDGSRIVSGSYDNTIQLWDGENGTLFCEPLCGHASPVRCVGMTADGTRIISGGNDNTLRVWDGRSGQALSVLRKHKGGVSAVGISADGLTIVSGSRDQSIRLWDLEKEMTVGDGRKGHRDSVLCVAISADGSRIASGSKDRTVRLWNGENGEPVCGALRGHDAPVMCVAFSTNGSLVVSGSDDRTVRIWDWERRREIREPLNVHRGGVTCVAANVDGRYVVSGSREGTLRLWDIEGTDFSTVLLQGHKKWVTCVAISPDGSIVVSGSRDRTVRLWHASSRRAVGSPVVFNACSIWMRDRFVFARPRSYAAEEVLTKCWQVDEEQGLVLSDSVCSSSVAANSHIEGEINSIEEELDEKEEDFDGAEELDGKREEFDGTEEELERKVEDFDCTEVEVEDKREAFDGTEEELDGTEEELDSTEEELDGKEEDFGGTEEQLDGNEEVLDATKEELDGNEEEQLDSNEVVFDTTKEELEDTKKEADETEEWQEPSASAEEAIDPTEELQPTVGGPDAIDEEVCTSEDETDDDLTKSSPSEDTSNVSWTSSMSEDDVPPTRPASMGMNFVKQYSFISCCHQVVIGGRTPSDDGVVLSTLPTSLGASVVEQDAWFFHPTSSSGSGGVLAVGLRDGTVCILKLLFR